VTDDLFPVGYRFNLHVDRAVFGPFEVVDYKQGLDRDGLPTGPIDYVVANANGDKTVMAHGYIRSVGRPIKQEDDDRG
jgi:hypothetical protein